MTPYTCKVHYNAPVSTDDVVTHINQLGAIIFNFVRVFASGCSMCQAIGNWEVNTPIMDILT